MPSLSDALRPLACLGLLALIATPAGAQDLPTPVMQWYEALRTADAAAFETLIANDATITLDQLGFDQTKAEFIESMDAWADAVQGASIETKPLESSSGSAIVRVCYRFPSNERLNRETFAFAGGQITAQRQQVLAEDCSDF